MSATIDPRLQQIAEECVANMGDIFWDYVPDRDKALDYTDPHTIAVEAVACAMQDFAKRFDTTNLFPGVLHDEYVNLVSTLPEEFTNDELIQVLIAHADWTKEGACEIVKLAQQYGTSVLRSALALADALGIEDGEAGL